ncbi:DNA-binding transcriptional regulator, AcrR family [Paraoerskovia marina]|uniref:DNA-binding transcriptional regulator, AcrR family n=1 Tax=Paraoerskovia marina TaxID=545619 RepID=A0A1H1NTE9_9CELL|nr:TetR-like C-terminal domain-containing protein [Paraoerskovia marina]SDS02070.1 DNA-binding transcriptional regulator, AcrR family [Paraoerskovia marina]
MPRARVHDDDLRTRLVERASQIIGAGGAEALSLRGLAAAEGTSTSAVYSLFGGKPALLGAVLDAAFESFGASQRDAASRCAAQEVGVPEELLALGRAYWTWGSSHPDLYAVAFGQATGIECEPPTAAARGAMGPLYAAVERGLADGSLRSEAPSVLVGLLWAAVHGPISLTLSGLVGDDRDAQQTLAEATMRAVVRGVSFSAAERAYG